MATDYDPRRPRLPKELAEMIDAARGQVPFNRFVVQALEEALRYRAVKALPPSLTPRAPGLAGSPRSAPFVCPVASCQWPGSEKQNDEDCPIHHRHLIPRRS